GEGEDARLLVLETVEGDAFALFHIGVIALAIAPAGFLAVHHRPAQTAHLVILVERRQVMAMAAAEAGIFLEQALLDVEAERLGLMIGIAFLDLAVREAVH